MNLSWLLPETKGIPVLMYHKVWPGCNDGLTTSPENLHSQWQYLQKQGYRAISLADYLNIQESGNGHYPPKTILITFDDGYANNLTYAYPMLRQFGWCATFFIIADTLDGTHSPAKEEAEKKMSLQELKELDQSTVQLGMHGYHHENFDKMTIGEIKTVIALSIEKFEQAGLCVPETIAYPYGARPKDKMISDELKAWMKDIGIKAAFRIGNQVSKIPSQDMYEIKRIDIKGTDTLNDFAVKLKKGKLKPF